MSQTEVSKEILDGFHQFQNKLIPCAYRTITLVPTPCTSKYILCRLGNTLWLLKALIYKITEITLFTQENPQGLNGLFKVAD